MFLSAHVHHSMKNLLPLNVTVIISLTSSYILMNMLHRMVVLYKVKTMQVERREKTTKEP